MPHDTTRPPGRRPDRRGNWFWSRMHFLVRVLGLLGVLAVCAGLFLARRIDQFYASWTVPYHTLRNAVEGAAPADFVAKLGVYCLLAGAAAVLAALLIEFLVILFFVAGRRSAMGLNAVVQIGLAAVLLVGVNVFAFWHPARKDCTRAHEFTLPADIEEKLQKLTGETTIVVYQAHQSLAAGDEKKRDAYDKAAEQKVIEIVNDLVEQFRQVGPQFQVHTLDSDDLKFARKLKDLTESPDHPRPALRDAINAAAESTIFFYRDTPYPRPDGTTEYRDGRTQQLSFREFYQLDKPASMAGNGNLVLLAQGGGASGRGVEAFAQKILNVDQRKPRVGLLVVHELLTSESVRDEFSLRGLREALTARGFEVRDIVLRKNWGRGGLPDPAADDLDESKLERVENQLYALERERPLIEERIAAHTQIVEDLTLKPGENEERKLDYLSQKYARELRGGRLTSFGRKYLLDSNENELARDKEDLAENKRDWEEKEKERNRLDTESVAKGRRMSDVYAKLKRAIDDCDLLIITRLTRSSVVEIPNRVHKLSDEQIAALKEFLKKGRPILACLGPVNEPVDEDDPRPRTVDRDDNLEALFADLGIRALPQTVLFKSDTKELAGRGSDVFTSSDDTKTPPLDFQSPTQLITTGRWFAPDWALFERPNPLREGMQVTARGSGSEFDLRLRFPRPVYYDPIKPWVPAAEAANVAGLLAAPLAAGPLAASVTVPRKAQTDLTFLTTGYVDGAQPWTQYAQVASTVGVVTAGPLPGLAALPRRRTDPTFLLTAVGWNESNPFADDKGRPPRYRAPKSDDPANGTLEEKRRGAFPVGVALETPLPEQWGLESPTLVRVAVIGQGDVFVGKDFKDRRANEQLLLETVNWLLGRDDALPTARHAVRYPRVELSEAEKEMWQWGCWVGMPAALAFLGVVVLLVRRLR